jgi:hypothetical protein
MKQRGRGKTPRKKNGLLLLGNPFFFRYSRKTVVHFLDVVRGWLPKDDFDDLIQVDQTPPLEFSPQVTYTFRVQSQARSQKSSL